MGEKKSPCQSAMSNGVNYSHVLQTETLSGRYECRIHRYFLDAGVGDFLSDPFTVARREWRLKMEDKDGRISVFVILFGELPTDTVYRFTLVNHLDSKKSITRGWRSMIEPGTAKGFSNLYLSSKIKDASAGYLLGDSFVIVVQLGRILADNCLLTSDIAGQTGKCTWRMRHLDDIRFSDIVLDDIEVDSTVWNLKLERRETASNEEDCRVFLFCRTDLPVEANFKFTVANKEADELSIVTEHVHTFPSGHSGWGWSDFIDVRQLLLNPQHGFLDDGWLTLKVCISFSIAKYSHLNATTESVTKPMCRVCHIKEQTSGFLHGKVSHKCFCAECCEKFYKNSTKCPVCNVRADYMIVDYD